MSSAGRYSIHIVVLEAKKTLGTYTWDGESLPEFEDGSKGFDDLKLRCGAESCTLNGGRLEGAPQAPSAR